MRAATELVATGHYPKRTEPFYFRAPGYPYFLAAATLGHPRSVAAGKAINAVLGALAASRHSWFSVGPLLQFEPPW